MFAHYQIVFTFAENFELICGRHYGCVDDII